MTLKSGGVSLDAVVEPIGLQNPLCNDGDESIVGCKKNPAYKECTHNEDVYLICDGNAVEVPEELGESKIFKPSTLLLNNSTLL